jgi:hypothetical protein
MVDSVASWSLDQVIRYLRKRVQEEKTDVQPVRLHCRSTVRSLSDLIDHLAVLNQVTRVQMSRWISYHGAAIARDDVVVAKIIELQNPLRLACLQDDDTDTLDMMHRLTPYSPRVADTDEAVFYLFDPFVASEFEEIAQVCGVFKYRVAQIFMLKSVLTSPAEGFGETVARFRQEIDRWDMWMRVRKDALVSLTELKKEKSKKGSVPQLPKRGTV